MHRRLVCVHGHFYQPPRENPWIEEVEIQDSAAPFHDWNARVAAECYGPNAAARLKDATGRIKDIVNNYRHISFNFGPTLLGWMERHAPEVYQRLLEADRDSVRRRGHGNALAQAYNHAILPLCSERDLRTQVRWGIADFRARFGRRPEGLWLPEMAVDLPTLRVLSEEGIRFTILAPLQATRVRGPSGAWQDAREGKFDPTRPYRVELGDGRSIAVFFYDEPIARAIAFGDGLRSGEELVRQIDGGFSPARGHDEVLTIAIDGETFGHHKRGGDEALAAALRRLSERGDVELVNLGQAFEGCPPDWEAEVAEGSSWSCPHGLARWRDDCGCRGGGEPGWTQAWRKPLRAALDLLRDRLAELFEREAGKLLRDPWAARDAFIEVVLARDAAARFLERQAGRVLDWEERVRALRLLEMQRQALLMYTSCGWFFSELSGIETVQILKYAARALQLAREAAGEDHEPAFKEHLSRAPSNSLELHDGARIYERLVVPSVVSLEGVAAHHAIASLFDGYSRDGRLFCYEVRVHCRRRESAGAATLSVSRLELRSATTQEHVDLSACVVHFSGSDFRCGLRPHDAFAHAEMERRLFGLLAGLSLAQLVREIDCDFTGRDYTLRDLFLDERRKLAEMLLTDTLRHYQNDYLQIYESSRRLIEFLREISSPVPRPLQVAADVALTHKAQEMAQALAAGEADLVAAQAELLGIAQLARRLGARIDVQSVRPAFDAAVEGLLGKLLGGRREAAVQLAAALDLAEKLGLHLDLWHAQNRVWDAIRSGAPWADGETVARLARRLWFDEAALVQRARAAEPPVRAAG